MTAGAGGLSGSCHCGAVSVRLPDPPDALTRCNCSLCVRTGGVWAYYDPADVVVTGPPLDAYIRADMAEPCLATERCATCGCVVRWRALVPLDPPRMGVNMNLFDPAELVGIEVGAVDGRSWPL